MPPEADLGVGLGVVVRGDADHLHPAGKFAKNQFTQDVVAPHGAAKNHHPRPAFGIFS